MDRATIKKLAKQADKKLRSKPRKATRTLSLSEEPYRQLQALAGAQGLSASEIVDELIMSYVALYES